jgi:hypothetical protein
MTDSTTKGSKMKDSRMLRALLAAVVLGTIVTPIATAGAKGKPSPQKSALRLLKGLQSETAAIAAEITALKAKIVTLEAPKQLPPAAPNGPAAGDLSGSYPNPKVRASSITSTSVLDGTLTGADLAPNTIDSSSIADGSVGGGDIADHSIEMIDLAPFSVGATQLVPTHVVRSNPNPIGGNSVGGNLATCPGAERLLAGGLEWETPNTNLFTLYSIPEPGNPNAWEVRGRNSSGSTDNLYAYALCLGAG